MRFNFGLLESGAAGLFRGSLQCTGVLDCLLQKLCHLSALLRFLGGRLQASRLLRQTSSGRGREIVKLFVRHSEQALVFRVELARIVFSNGK